ncbi:hypothetical protein AMECASPLE_028330, partial [Ameca splendens]
LPPPSPEPSPQQRPSTSREGDMYKRGVYMAQSYPPTGAAPGRSSPDPQTSSDPNPMSLPPPVNPNKNLPTGPPPTRTPLSNTSPRTQTPQIPTPTGAFLLLTDTQPESIDPAVLLHPVSRSDLPNKVPSFCYLNKERLAPSMLSHLPNT